MKLKKILPLIFTVSCFIIGSSVYGQSPKRDIYELRIYHIENSTQEKRIDDYLENAFLPALHNSGINKVGVFKPVISDEEEAGQKIYVFIPYESMQQYLDLPEKLENDQKYMMAGKDYIDAAHNDPTYERMETILMKAFTGMPQFKESKLKGPKKDRVYELRSYESATEKQHRNKVKMFNEGEIDIFNKLDFNAVFYGEVIAGANMPNLMYMTTFSDMASEKEHWEAFGTDPDWEKMKVMEEYQNNVSRNDTKLLYPAEYSDI
ncbi:MAG: NIPSNAP family protein [Anditalea sp.]